MDLWIVAGGDAFRLYEATEDRDGLRLPGREHRRLWREDYGRSWIVVTARTPHAARVRARSFEERRHPAQGDMELIATAYRAGAVTLMGLPPAWAG